MLPQCLVVALLFGTLGFSTNAIADSPLRIRADQSAAVAVTNAERFALGLPPLPPRRRMYRLSPSSFQLHISPIAPTPRQIAPRSGSSPVPSITQVSPLRKYTCLIAVRQINNNVFLGYLTPATSGQAVKLQTSVVNAVVGTFKMPIGVASPGGMLVYDTSNGLVLAGLSAFNVNVNKPMSAASINYVTLSSVDPPSDTPPTFEQGYFQSAIWSYNVVTRILSPQWINPDGTVINLNIDVYSFSDLHLTARSVLALGVRRVRFECAGS
ncbi:hypothetical protein R3P38DRAFT_3206311 [Favolaschia claudopus]|uniref:Uncharacterized protein n=1 Tax=Favolaschia claudopus TaxID=2862362 RepID=A0AAW0AMJ5_9AGAR